MKVQLLNNRGKSWKNINSSYIKGFAFDGNKFLTEEEIYNYVLDSIKNRNIDKCLLKLNGNFSAVISLKNSIYLFSDKYKTYPLLYFNTDKGWFITDQSKSVLDNIPSSEFNNEAIITYFALGYLHGNHTFLNNCKIVEAGNWVLLTNNSFSQEYHNHIYPKINIDDDEIMAKAINTFENAIKRTLSSIGNNPIWIPLSGGYDSRLLACVLKKMNIKNVKCFTYGFPNSLDVKISRKVAETLDFAWFYVEYTKEKFESIANNSIDDDHILWAMNLNTTSHYQDFIAIKELTERGVIEKNAIIIPGHSGEILGRDQIPYDLLESKKSIAELIYHKYFHWNLIKKGFKESIVTSLGVNLNETITNKKNKMLSIDLFSNWNIKNRQSNFIVNAVRAYEYFNLDWRLPLWDDEVSEFWFSLNYKKNSNLKLYNKFMFDNYFTPLNVAFYKEKNILKKVISKIRLPLNFKSQIKNILIKFHYFKVRYDLNGFNYKANLYLKKIKSDAPSQIVLKETDTNSVLAFYQYDLLKRYLGNDK